MTDSLDKMLSSAMDETPEPLQNDSKPETPQAEPESEETTSATEAEAEEVQEEETFAEKPELTGKTPEELERIHQEWQKAYTQKRQKEREELREWQNKYEALQKQLESGAGQSKYQPDIDKVRDAREEVQRRYQSGNMTDGDYQRYMYALNAEEFKLQGKMDAEREFSEAEMQRQDEDYQKQAEQTFYNADPRLNPDSPTFNERMMRSIAGDMDVLLSQYMEQNGTSVGFDTQSEVQRLVEEYDADMSQYIKQTVQRSSEAARSKVAQAKKNVSGATHNTSQGKVSLDDLLAKQMN